MMIKATMAVFLFTTFSIQSTNASPNTTYNEEHGDDYIVQGLNLKKLEDKLYPKIISEKLRGSYVQKYPLTTYP